MATDDLLTVAGTVFVSAALSYVLFYPRRKQPASTDTPAVAVEEQYFQAVVTEAPAKESWSGEEQGCSWTQSDSEVEVTVRVSDRVRAKDIQCRILTSSISLQIQGTLILEGTLFRRVNSDDCDWTLEGSGESRVLKLTLVKAVATKDSQNWTRLLRKQE